MQAHPLATGPLALPLTANHPTATQLVEAWPQTVVKRRAVASNGIVAETVQAAATGKLEFSFRAPLHLLIVFEQGKRSDGSTFVEGLPRSALRDLRRKITLVPAGCDYREWHAPSTPMRIAYFYVEPSRMPVGLEAGTEATPLAPRLFVENPALSDTALKLKRLIETLDSGRRPYFDALCAVLLQEFALFSADASLVPGSRRGGLAAWQQRLVTRYIEEHAAEAISLATLAQMVGLSRYHFCRAFKQSLGMPPHRYCSARRIERAKILLADSTRSVTEIGMAVGFTETSSFTTAFHKAIGLTPTTYRRTLA